MSITQQLFQLQELDLEIEADEQSLSQKARQMADDEALTVAKSRLAGGQQELAALQRQQRAAEGEIDDYSGKIAAAEEQLYSGRTSNPKELANLQHEANTLKEKRGRTEDQALAVLERLETAEAAAALSAGELKQAEAEWQQLQQQLSAEIEQLRGKLTTLAARRQSLLNRIDNQAADLYQKLRKQKGQAVSRVERGICRGCRISLASSELQQARSGKPVQCSSCGRILYLP